MILVKSVLEVVIESTLERKYLQKYGEAKIKRELKKMGKTEKEAAWGVKSLKIKSIHIFLVCKYVELTGTTQL